jgi:DNA-binding IclR family transcriptional regulator
MQAVNLFHNVDMLKAPDSSLAKTTNGAQSLRRAVAVLRALAAAQDQGARLADIAAQCNLTRPTAHRLLQALVEEGLAERTPRSMRYVIGRDATLFGMARSSPFPIREVAEPFLQRICEATGDSTVLTLRSGPDSICVDRRTGSYPIQVMSVAVGARLPLGVGVGGLVMLAFLSDEEIAQLLRKNETRLARRRLSPDELLERVRAVRERQYAFTEAGVIPGTHVLAVPVFDDRERPVAAISINAMANRLPVSRARQLVPMLVEQAAGIGRQYGMLGKNRRD